MTTVTLSNGKRFAAERGITLLDAASAAGLVLEHGCRVGRCSSCKAHVASGESAPLRAEESLGADERAAGWVLTCTREAVTDLTLDIEDLTALKGITTKLLPSRIESLARPAPDVVTVRLRLPPTAGFAFLPGQYVDVTSPSGATRSYSLANAAAEGSSLELHVKAVDGGELSRYWFNQAQANDLLRFRGPLGTFFLRDVAGLHLVFLATGTGIAPIKSMLAHLAGLPSEQRPATVRLYWGARRAEDLYWDPLETLPTLRYTPVLSRAGESWTGARGHVQDVLLTELPAPDRTTVYACGSDLMIHDAKAALTAAGIPSRRFFADAFVSSRK
jgi:CDP-4-dehydro-6-deoxyglucose reductase